MTASMIAAYPTGNSCQLCSAAPLPGLGRIDLQQLGGSQEHAGRAETALQRGALVKGALKDLQPA
jgi:hypothetical protein